MRRLQEKTQKEIIGLAAGKKKRTFQVEMKACRGGKLKGRGGDRADFIIQVIFISSLGECMWKNEAKRWIVLIGLCRKWKKLF